METYQFKMWGKRFAVDVASGNFFEVDKIASDALRLLPKYSKKEIKHRLHKKYGHESVNKAVRNLFMLKR